jgi:hypothetical protein
MNKKIKRKSLKFKSKISKKFKKSFKRQFKPLDPQTTKTEEAKTAQLVPEPLNKVDTQVNPAININISHTPQLANQAQPNFSLQYPGSSSAGQAVMQNLMQSIANPELLNNPAAFIPNALASSGIVLNNMPQVDIVAQENKAFIYDLIKTSVTSVATGAALNYFIPGGGWLGQWIGKIIC